MGKYYKIEASIDPKIIGRSGIPLTIEIKDKQFLEYRKVNLTDINKCFHKDNLYNQFPKRVEGRMYQRKKQPIDIMNVMPSCLSLKYIISEKIKNILEDIVKDKSEYHLEEVKIEKYTEKFYFFFVPFLKNWEVIDYSKTLFFNSLHDKEVVFGSFENYEREKLLNNYLIKDLFISDHLKEKHLINIPVGGVFYREEIIEAFNRENVIGYDLVKQGDFKVNLHFTDL